MSQTAHFTRRPSFSDVTAITMVVPWEIHISNFILYHCDLQISYLGNKKKTIPTPISRLCRTPSTGKKIPPEPLEV